MDNLEKLAHRVHKTKKNKNTTQYVLDTNASKHKYYNKTWTLPQTTEGKDEPNIVFMRKW
jgi:hypothetical protein